MIAKSTNHYNLQMNKTQVQYIRYFSLGFLLKIQPGGYLGCVCFGDKGNQETFYTLEGVWVRKENWVKWKIISVDRKICPLTL